MLRYLPPFFFLAPHISNHPLTNDYFVASRVFDVQIVQIVTSFTMTDGQLMSPVSFFFHDVLHAYIMADNDMHWKMLPEEYGGYIKNDVLVVARREPQLPPLHPNDISTNCAPNQTRAWWKCWYPMDQDVADPPSRTWLRGRLLTPEEHNRIIEHRVEEFTSISNGDDLGELFILLHEIGLGVAVLPLDSRVEKCVGTDDEQDKALRILSKAGLKGNKARGLLIVRPDGKLVESDLTPL